MKHTRNSPVSRKGGRGALNLAAVLRDQVASGAFPVGKFIPPVRTLAHTHGAATVTVNRALKMLAGEGLVTAHPRHGYRVRPSALDPERGLPIAYLNSTRHEVGSGRDLFHRTLLMEFQRVAGQRGWALLSLDVDNIPTAEALVQVQNAKCSGIVSNTVRGELWTSIAATGIPAVVVDAWREDLQADCVLQDGFMGGLQAAAHLISRGHARIAWLGPELKDGNTQVLERFSGARAALTRAGLDFARVAEAPLGDPARALEAAKKLLSGADRPKAILALWQDMSAALARAAAELGLAVGRDFEMVGWSTEEEYEPAYAPLFPAGRVPATVVWSIARMADAAVARLKQRRAEPNLAPAMIRIPTAIREGVRQ
jgi:DNA-binding LacI/PurR family transcriptional regulator